MDQGHSPTTDHLPRVRAELTGYTALVQYQHSVKGDNLCANTVTTIIEPILIIRLILFKVHFSRDSAFENIIFQLDTLFGVEFHVDYEFNVYINF